MEISSEKDFDIKRLTTFKIGGKIKEVFFPQSLEEFEQILKENKDIKVFGNLSNTLISSDGYNGKIVLTTKMNNIKIDETRVVADAGVKGPKLSQEVYKNGLSGLEFMIGFPGSIGGEVCMNASANKQAISDTLTSVICYSKDKGLVKFSKDEMEFAYRTSRCQCEDLIVLQAKFVLSKKNKDEIQSQMESNLE